jgi:type II secretory ATPase GspE/PulE/Tfp pilus assembly ATPase PilB-like protein
LQPARVEAQLGQLKVASAGSEEISVTLQAVKRAPGRRTTVGTIDGEEFIGEVREFAPADAILTLEPDGSPDGRTPQRIATSSIAYVAFWRSQDTPPCERKPGSGALRVHLTNDRTFLVEPLGDPQDALGFRSIPSDEKSEFAEIFFFAKGAKVIEKDESIGSMLMREAGLARDDLQRGLARQSALGRRKIGDILLEQKRIAPEVLDQALSIQQRRRARLGEILVERGVVAAADIDAALAEQRRQGSGRLGDILVEMGVISPITLATTLAKKFHLPYVDLDDCLIDPDAAHAIPATIIEKYGILPIGIENGEITVAVSDPLNAEPIDLIRFHRPGRIREVVVLPSQLAECVGRALSELRAGEGNGALARQLASDVRAEAVESEDTEADASEEIRDSDNTVIQLANQILVEAVQRKASDIHIEPDGGRGVRIRFRIDGECLSFLEVPASYRSALVSRLKIMAHLDIAERRKPQDGRIRVRLDGQPLELRVATIPTLGGEDVVMRLLASSKPLPLSEMGLSERNERELRRLVRMPYGLVLCVGPTGSGKTTSLHSLIGDINSIDRKIWTAEDPVEITQRGLRQVQVQPKIGFGFADALRAFMRADPDVIMVGEMRDCETANIAIQAALTGHLVCSTLHTNSAPETVTRLIEMGVDPFVFGDSLLCVLAQRLTRRLCEACRSLEPAAPDDREALLDALGTLAASTSVGQLLWRARGCKACRNTGYRGRVALHELLVVDPALRSAIHARATAEPIRELALAGGMTTLLQDGAVKCLTGATDLKQVLAVCAR